MWFSQCAGPGDRLSRWNETCEWRWKPRDAAAWTIERRWPSRRGGWRGRRREGRRRGRRVSSSRQKQIAIVCGEQRQRGPWGASITCLSRLYHSRLSLLSLRCVGPLASLLTIPHPPLSRDVFHGAPRVRRLLPRAWRLFVRLSALPMTSLRAAPFADYCRG